MLKLKVKLDIKFVH